MGKRVARTRRRPVGVRAKRRPVGGIWSLGAACALAACLCWGALFAALEPGGTAAGHTDPPARTQAAPASDPGGSGGTQAAPASDPGGSGRPWNLTLVNDRNPIPQDYAVTLVRLKNSQAVDKRCYPALQDMMDACRAAGLSPLICSSYRTQADQQRLFDNHMDGLIAQGDTRARAEEQTRSLIAVPGTSEHQLGLAVDIVDLNYQLLDRGQEETQVQKWLMAHCWEYGFILRYPEDKSELTGISYEPWHYRYVGRAAAREITRAGLCLEEYLSADG